MRRRNQPDEGRDGPRLHHGGRLLRRPRGDVSQSPGRLELDVGEVELSQEAYESRDEARGDDAVDRRLLFFGEEFSETQQEMVREKSSWELKKKEGEKNTRRSFWFRKS